MGVFEPPRFYSVVFETTAATRLRHIDMHEKCVEKTLLLRHVLRDGFEPSSLPLGNAFTERLLEPLAYLSFWVE